MRCVRAVADQSCEEREAVDANGNRGRPSARARRRADDLHGDETTLVLAVVEELLLALYDAVCLIVASGRRAIIGLIRRVGRLARRCGFRLS